MSAAEESPAQQAARLRRERREAKIKAGGSARLDKITSLSGRTLLSEPSSSAAQFTPTSESRLRPAQSSASQPPPPNVKDQLPESIQAQEEYLRALLRSQQPLGQTTVDQDPTTKLFNSFFGISPPDGAPSTDPSADISSATGLPLFLTNLFLGQSQAESPAEQQKNWVWNLLHVFFAFAVGMYFLTLARSSVSTYGSNPPPPATAQNPFIVFVTGEFLLSGLRVLARARAGHLGSVRPWMRLLGDMARDGKIAIFILGVGTWWMGGWKEIDSKS